MSPLRVIIAFVLVFFILHSSVFAEDQPILLDSAPDLSNNLPALQRGAKLFINYCLNCHSARAMRYSHLTGIGLAEKQIKDYLLFTGDQVTSPMAVALTEKDAKTWFGVAPPDLSTEARARGADWLYTYLRSFYRDETRPNGWNNLVFPNVSMPHVLWQLQGQQSLKQAKFDQQSLSRADLKISSEGLLSPLHYDAAVADLVAYLVWMSEPTKSERKRLGVWVLLFLGLFAVFAWGLNLAYWKAIK